MKEQPPVEALLPEHAGTHIFVADNNDRERVIHARDEVHTMLNEVMH
jgi:hypothetical protein